MKKILSIILAVLLFAGSAFGATYIVATGETHETIASAYAVAVAGDIIDVQEDQTIASAISMSRSGTSGNPITITSTNGSTITTDSGQNTTFFYADYITFSNLTFSGGTNYVLMGLTLVDGGEAPDYYELINGATTIQVTNNNGIIVGQVGSNLCVLFSLASLRPYAPPTWSVLDMSDWLSQSDGFLAFDWRMLGVYVSTALTIQNRAYTYEQVRDAVYRYEWWDFVGDEWVKSTGFKADYMADGYPSKLVRVVPMPVYLGINE